MSEDVRRGTGESPEPERALPGSQVPQLARDRALVERQNARGRRVTLETWLSGKDFPRAGSYEPPLSQEGTAITSGQEPLIAPGVRGYAIEKNGVVYIPVVAAEPNYPGAQPRERRTIQGITRPIFRAGGSGDVGRFIDALSPRCVFSGVITPQLQMMLKTRGWSQVRTRRGGMVVWTHPKLRTQL